MGDFWVTSKANGEASIKTAVRSRADGAFTDTDWIDFKYADKADIDNAVKEYDTSLGQDEVFNKLTNGGKDQGIYIQDGKLYINANYILAGLLAGKFINAKGIKVIDKDDQTTLYIDDSGKVYILATEFSLQGKSVSDIATDAATEEAKKYKTLNVMLSNEYQSIPTDSAGNYTTFPDCKTTVTALYGDENVTSSATITFTAGSGVAGSKSGATYTVTKLASDIGTVAVNVSYNGLSVEKQFTIAKQKQGSTGNGISKITQYYLASSNSSGVTTSTSGWTETVQAPTLSERYLWSYQTTTYTDKTTANTTPHVIGVYGESGKDGKDGKDASDMTQLEIFNKLTNNGDTQGIYLYDNKVYLNASYIDTGYLAGWEVGYQKLTADGTYGKMILDASAGEIYSETNSGVYVPGYGTLYGTRIRGINLYTGTVHASSVSVDTSVSADSVSASKKIKAGTHIEASGHFYSTGTGTDLADLSVRGTKKRILSTENYGTQAFYCYEMASPIFGDIGEAFISEDGACLIDIDDIFQESTNLGIEYYVFLQKEGDGDCWIDKKEQTYFTVKGTPGLKFAFEIKARQADYEHMRFADASETAYDRAIDTDMPEPDYSESLVISEPDYETELIDERTNIINQMEVAS